MSMAATVKNTMEDWERLLGAQERSVIMQLQSAIGAQTDKQQLHQQQQAASKPVYFHLRSRRDSTDL
jgi:hypothetical protein